MTLGWRVALGKGKGKGRMRRRRLGRWWSFGGGLSILVCIECAGDSDWGSGDSMI